MLSAVDPQLRSMERTKSFVLQRRVEGDSGACAGAPGGVAYGAGLPRSNSFHNIGGGGNNSNSSNLFHHSDSKESKPKFKMKESTKLLVKMHVIRTKAVSLEELLAQLWTLTSECADDEHGDGNSREAFAKKALEIDKEVKLAKKLVLLLCRHRQLERHYGVLSSIQAQMSATFDISVEFFGIDWLHIKRVSSNLVQLTSELIDALRANEQGWQPEIDIVLPSNILRNLATIEADVGSHAEAVLRGRLSRRHHEDICAGQDRFRQVLDQVAQAMEDQQREERHHHDGNSQEEALVREKRTLWHAFKDFQTNVVRKVCKRNQQRSDDLWRLWYLGVQSMTLSVSAMTTNPVDGNESTTTSSSMTAGKTNGGEKSPCPPVILELPRIITPLPDGADSDPCEVLGVYSTHPLGSSSAGGSFSSNMFPHDDEDIDNNLDWDNAPRQDLEESQL